MSANENHTVPPEIHESWRTWLMTGARRTPVDRRRLRGGQKGLKKILLEGLTGNGNGGQKWQDFSGAMVRHAVDDAMRSLPDEQRRVVKLAYFGGYSNREIAREVGLTQGTVERRLRRALAAISDHIQHGQAVGRRALYGLAFALSGRWLSEHVWTATAVAGAVVVVAATQPSPVAVHHSAVAAAPPASRPAAVAGPSTAATSPVQSVQQATQSLPVKVPAVQVPKVKIALPSGVLAKLRKLL